MGKRKSWLIALALIASGFMPGALSTAHANDGKVTSLLYTCNVAFQATGQSIYIGVGYTDLKGKGAITCHDYATGAQQIIPIKITARGPGAGLGVTGLAVSGGAVGIGLSKSPEALLGRYIAVRGGAAAGVGASASAGIRVSNGSATLDVSIQGQGGLGVGVDLLFIDIEADDRAKLVDQNQSQNSTHGKRTVPVKILYVTEGQPVHLVDSEGRLLQIIYLKPSR